MVDKVEVSADMANDLMEIQEAAREVRDRFAEQGCEAAIPRLDAALRQYDERLRAAVEARFATKN